MAAVGRQRSTRGERERIRVYEARLALHRGQQHRRSRDNLLAGIVGGILILGVVGGQVAYFTLGPGVPSPSPSPSATAPATPPLPVPTPEPTTTLQPSATPGSTTPEPTTTP